MTSWSYCKYNHVLCQCQHRSARLRCTIRQQRRWIFLRRVAKLLAEKGFKLEATEAAREYLAEVGYDPQFGARPLKRAIQRELQDPLALKILAGEFKEGDTIKVERGDAGLILRHDAPVVEGEVVA